MSNPLTRTKNPTIKHVNKPSRYARIPKNMPHEAHPMAQMNAKLFTQFPMPRRSL